MFKCEDCGKDFDLRPEVLERYPGWTPRQCMDCRGKASQPTKPAAKRPRSASKSRDLSVSEVLDSFSDGPDTGVFTDGASEGNPGPGGWGTVYVVEGQIVEEAMGADPDTTNNRMELTAMIAGLKMLDPGSDMDVYTDSKLVVDILNTWAAGWKANGWKKKSTGPIANLELVKESFALSQERPNVRIQWIKAHSGNRWNEYADSLATSYRRDVH